MFQIACWSISHMEACCHIVLRHTGVVEPNVDSVKHSDGAPVLHARGSDHHRLPTDHCKHRCPVLQCHQCLMLLLLLLLVWFARRSDPSGSFQHSLLLMSSCCAQPVL